MTTGKIPTGRAPANAMSANVHGRFRQTDQRQVPAEAISQQPPCPSVPVAPLAKGITGDYRPRPYASKGHIQSETTNAKH